MILQLHEVLDIHVYSTDAWPPSTYPPAKIFHASSVLGHIPERGTSEEVQQKVAGS